MIWLLSSATEKWKLHYSILTSVLRSHTHSPLNVHILNMQTETMFHNFKLVSTKSTTVESRDSSVSIFTTYCSLQPVACIIESLHENEKGCIHYPWQCLQCWWHAFHSFESHLAKTKAIIGGNRKLFSAKNTIRARSKCTQLNHYLFKLGLN